MDFLNIEVPPIEEGSCLLRNYALEKIRTEDQEVVIFHYAAELQPSSKKDSERSNVARVNIGKRLNLGKGRIELYLEDEGPTRIKPGYLSKDESIVKGEAKGITVFDFVGCDIGNATLFINALRETLQWSNSSQELSSPDCNPRQYSKPPGQVPRCLDPSAVLAATSLDYHQPHCHPDHPTPDTFITGISLRAGIEPNKFLTLFVSIPYLGIGDNVTTSGSRTLQQYRFRESPKEQSQSDENMILVHQTWLLTFDSETIAIFRSANDQNKDRAPLFAFQQRGCVFQALVHMISNILTSSDQQVMEMFRRRVSSWVSPITPERFSRNTETLHGRKCDQVEHGIIDLITMTQVVRSQIAYLEELRQIFQNSCPDVDPRTHRNQYPIPFMDNQEAQIRDVIQGINEIIAEREKFYQELGNLMKELELLQTIFLNRHTTKLESDNQEFARFQAATVSLFTLTSVVFLPLGFFTSYYSSSINKSVITVKEFWAITAPVSMVLVLLFSVSVFQTDAAIRDWIRGHI